MQTEITSVIPRGNGQVKRINNIMVPVVTKARMKHKANTELLSIIEQEVVQMYDEQRDQLRVEAKENILRKQEENRRTYNKTCKPARQYQKGDLVVIKRTQFEPGHKVSKKYVGYMKFRKLRETNDMSFLK